MEVYCASIRKAVESWKHVQSDPSYYITFGEALFGRIFELAPSAVSLFHFAEGGKPCETVDDFESSPMFHPHARAVLITLERALVMMLKNQIYDLSETLASLGSRHAVYGVTTDHFKVLEAAVLDTLEETLLSKTKWTKTLKKDWEGVLNFLCKGMVVGAERGFSIKRKERQLGELSVATLRLKPTATVSPTTSESSSSFPSRFDLIGKSIQSPLPKPSNLRRSRFDSFSSSCEVDDTMPRTPKRNSALQKRNTEPVFRIPENLVLGPLPSTAAVATHTTIPLLSRRQTSKRRHTSTSTNLGGAVAVVRAKVDQMTIPSSPPDHSRALHLRHELFDIGLGLPAACPIRMKRPGKKKPNNSGADTACKAQSEPKRHSINFKYVDASTSSWPILGLAQPEDAPPTFHSSWPVLGLEPDATPVLPRRQLSPKVTARKKSQKKLPLESMEVIEKPCLC
ncbi:MAG: hypothetical protein SGBAC_011154 [Bacillariaceae sp.]